MEPIACAPEGELATVQGGVSVWNADRDEEYVETTLASPGETVRLQLWVFNRSTSHDILDPVAQFRLGDQPAAGLIVEARMCSANAALLSSGATIVGADGPIAAEFIPESVSIRALIDGEYRDRPGSDAAFQSTGESLGRIPFNLDPDLAHLSIAVDVLIVSTR